MKWWYQISGFTSRHLKLIIAETMLENNTELATKLSKLGLSERHTYQIDSSGYSKSFIVSLYLDLRCINRTTIFIMIMFCSIRNN